MRLDVYLVDRGLAPTRTRAANMIRLGGVSVNGKRVDKPAYDVGEGDEVVAEDVIGYASLGGLKLQKALDTFGIEISGRAVDIGASNGGFTHCLLQHGARHVYAVDVGDCALPDFLVRDGRVTPMPNTNARSLTREDLGGAVQASCCTAREIRRISVQQRRRLSRMVFPSPLPSRICRAPTDRTILRGNLGRMALTSSY